MELTDFSAYESDPLSPEEIRDDVPDRLLIIPERDMVNQHLGAWINAFSGFPSPEYHPQACAMFVQWCGTIHMQYGDNVVPSLLMHDYFLNDAFAKTLPREMVWDIIPAGVTYGQKYLLWDDPWDEGVYTHLIEQYGNNTDYPYNLGYDVFTRFMQHYPQSWGKEHLEEVALLMHYQSWVSYPFSTFAKPVKQAILESESITAIAYLFFSKGIPSLETSLNALANTTDFFDIYYPRINELRRGKDYLERIAMYWMRALFDQNEPTKPFEKIEQSLAFLQQYDLKAGLKQPSILTSVWALHLEKMRMLYSLDVDVLHTDFTSKVSSLEVPMSLDL